MSESKPMFSKDPLSSYEYIDCDTIEEIQNRMYSIKHSLEILEEDSCLNIPSQNSVQQFIKKCEDFKEYYSHVGRYNYGGGWTTGYIKDPDFQNNVIEFPERSK